MWSVSLLVCSTYTYPLAPPPPAPPTHTPLFLSPQRSKQGKRRNKNKRTKAVMSGIQMLAFYYGLHMFFKDTLASSLPFAYPPVSAAACPDRGNANLTACNSAVSSCPLRYTLHLQALSVAILWVQQNNFKRAFFYVIFFQIFSLLI